MREAILTTIVATGLLCQPLLAATENDIHDIAPGNYPALASDKKAGFFAAFEWRAPNSTVKQVYFSRSSDGGKTWDAPINIAKEPANCRRADITYNSRGIEVVWIHAPSNGKESNIQASHSTDGGKTWTKPVDISQVATTAADPAVTSSPDGSLHVVWQNKSSTGGNPDIHYSSSSDGQKWSPPIEISNTPGLASTPTIAASDDGLVHVAWLDTTPGDTRPDIYYTCLSKGTWKKPIDVSNSPQLSAHPSIACGSAGKVFVTWVDNSLKHFAPDIWCAVADKPGVFSKPLNLSDTPGVSSEPRIVADTSGRVAAVWADTSGRVQSPAIFATVSFDNLSKVSSAMDLTPTKGASRHPALALGSDNVVFVWEETAEETSTIRAMSKGFPHK